MLKSKTTPLLLLIGWAVHPYYKKHMTFEVEKKLNGITVLALVAIRYSNPNKHISHFYSAIDYQDDDNEQYKQLMG